MNYEEMGVLEELKTEGAAVERNKDGNDSDLSDLGYGGADLEVSESVYVQRTRDHEDEVGGNFGGVLSTGSQRGPRLPQKAVIDTGMNLSGFAVEIDGNYTPVNDNTAHNLESVKARFTDGKYLAITPGGGMKLCKILEGNPTVVHHGKKIASMVDGEWLQ